MGQAGRSKLYSPLPLKFTLGIQGCGSPFPQADSVRITSHSQGDCHKADMAQAPRQQVSTERHAATPPRCHATTLPLGAHPSPRSCMLISEGIRMASPEM